MRLSYVPPGLTAGGGLKLSRYAQFQRGPSSPRPHRRGRIETLATQPDRDHRMVPPGLTAGGGLKLEFPVCFLGRDFVPPGLTAGGGLKRY